MSQKEIPNQLPLHFYNKTQQSTPTAATATTLSIISCNRHFYLYLNSTGIFRAVSEQLLLGSATKKAAIVTLTLSNYGYWTRQIGCALIEHGKTLITTGRSGAVPEQLKLGSATYNANYPRGKWQFSWIKVAEPKKRLLPTRPWKKKCRITCRAALSNANYNNYSDFSSFYFANVHVTIMQKR